MVNLHLSHLEGRDDLRRLQLETVIDALRARGKDRFALAGDFNCGPESPVLRWTGGLTNLSVADACAAETRPIANQSDGSGTTPGNHIGIVAETRRARAT